MEEIEKTFLAAYIVIMVLTAVPNAILLYKRYISKEYEDLTGGGFGQWMALWFSTGITLILIFTLLTRFVVTII